MKTEKLMNVIFSGELAAAEKAIADAIFGKLAKNGQINRIAMHLKKYNFGGTRTKNHIVLHAATDFGFLLAEGIDWTFGSALSSAVNRLGEQLAKRTGKAKDKFRDMRKGKSK